MMELIRETNVGEAKVWLKEGEIDTADVCVKYAETCTAVIASLKKLKRLDKCFLPLKDAF